MSDNDKTDAQRNNFTLVVVMSVVLALILVATGIYFYTQPDITEPQDQTQSIESTTNDETVTPGSLRQTIDRQLNQFDDKDFDQSALDDDALNIN